MVVVPSREFALAPLSRFAPEAAFARSGNDRVQLLVLALAAVFNDLKGLLLWDELRRTSFATPRPLAISAHGGQVAGLDIQLTRLFLGHLHEFLRPLAEFEEEARGEEVAAILAKAVPATRKQWKELVDVAVGTADARAGKLAKVLIQVRNAASFHYYQPKALAAGYRKHFYDEKPSPRNEAAYASLGSTMEQTRFYFVDAAYSALLHDSASQIGGPEQFKKHMRRLVKGINNTLSFIVAEYLKWHDWKAPGSTAW